MTKTRIREPQSMMSLNQNDEKRGNILLPKIDNPVLTDLQWHSVIETWPEVIAARRLGQASNVLADNVVENAGAILSRAASSKAEYKRILSFQHHLARLHFGNIGIGLGGLVIAALMASFGVLGGMGLAVNAVVILVSLGIVCNSVRKLAELQTALNILEEAYRESCVSTEGALSTLRASLEASTHAWSEEGPPAQFKTFH